MSTKTSLVAICLAFVSLTASAARRGTSLGEWQTGDFSSPDLASRWGYGDSNGAHNEISVDKNQRREGKATIRLVTNAGFDNWVYFPNTKDLDIDLTQAAAMRCHLRSVNTNGWGGDPWVIFVDMAGKKARFDGQKRRLGDAMKDWSEIVVPVGTDLEAKCARHGWKAKVEAGFDWRHVACVQIHQDTDGYGYSIWYSGCRFVGDQPVKWWLSSTEMPDISVTYAEQVPQYRRCFPTEPDPKHNIPELVGGAATEQHWPAPGEKVTYLVHMKNAGFARSEKTDFACAIDGEVVKTATIPRLAPEEETQIEVAWKWRQGSHDFVARADTKNKMCEISKKNNSLEFKTDAYALAAVCEKGIVEPIRRVNNWYGSFCFEDWMRGATADQINRMLKRSRYDFAPEGGQISVRIGKIFIVDKLADSSGKSIDKTLNLALYDGTWHYDIRALDEWRDLANDFDWALVHELTHQLGIIDDYQYDLGPDVNLVNHKGYDRGPGGIMGGGQTGTNAYPAYADVDIAGMNLTKGHRRGFYGEYLYCIPARNTLIVTVKGEPLAGADLEIYQKNTHSGKMDKPAVFAGKTGSKGEYPLANREVPKNFTTATGCTLHPNPFGYPDVVGRNGLFLVRAQVGGSWHYAFIDIGRFVVEYARGHKDLATYQIDLKPEN